MRGVYYCVSFSMIRASPLFIFFFFNDTATTEIYTLSLHDALPISRFCCLCTLDAEHSFAPRWRPPFVSALAPEDRCQDRKSTRLNSSHQIISYAVFCLKKKKNRQRTSYIDELRERQRCRRVDGLIG